MLKQISSQLAIAVENALAYQEITGIKDQLAGQKQYSRTRSVSSTTRDIIGDSPALKRVLQAVRLSRDEATVLLRGETGTARKCSREPSTPQSAPRAHVRSPEHGGAAVTLIESELFGYEKGRSREPRRQDRPPGAGNRARCSSMKSATSAGVQPKLLRALQERESSDLAAYGQRVDVA